MTHPTHPLFLADNPNTFDAAGRRADSRLGMKRLSAHPTEPGYPCYVSVLGELAWMPPRGELQIV